MLVTKRHPIAYIQQYHTVLREARAACAVVIYFRARHAASRAEVRAGVLTDAQLLARRRDIRVERGGDVAVHFSNPAPILICTTLRCGHPLLGCLLETKLLA